MIHKPYSPCMNFKGVNENFNGKHVYLVVCKAGGVTLHSYFKSHNWLCCIIYESN